MAGYGTDVWLAMWKLAKAEVSSNITSSSLVPGTVLGLKLNGGVRTFTTGHVSCRSDCLQIQKTIAIVSVAVHKTRMDALYGEPSDMT